MLKKYVAYGQVTLFSSSNLFMTLIKTGVRYLYYTWYICLLFIWIPQKKNYDVITLKQVLQT